METYSQRVAVEPADANVGFPIPAANVGPVRANLALLALLARSRS